MSDEIREKGIEEKMRGGAPAEHSHNEEPEVEGHMFKSLASNPDAKRPDKVEVKRV